MSLEELDRRMEQERSKLDQVVEKSSGYSKTKTWHRK